jgi:methylenetetrahydrofolate dehydrogenase (NADP+)/methenyltetrahydrofolate cyclohydrolase
MIVDGRALATEITARAKARAEKLPRRPTVVALVKNETPATKSYLKIKASRAEEAGCDFEVRPFPSAYDDADAVIIQLPLPEGVDMHAALDAIPVAKDADVLSAEAREKFDRGDADALVPPVTGAVREVLLQSKIDVKGKQAVVIGAGFLVGAPTATWLEQQGASVELLTIESTSEAFTAALRAADIIVSGAGSPHLIKPAMIKEGVVLIDAGTSELGGKIAGDADPACADKCAVFTPVPGGIGPIAVACLFENAVSLAQH